MPGTDDLNSHVLMFSEFSTSPEEGWDITLGTLILLAGLLGIVGNSLSLGYFWQTRRNDLATQLYLLIGVIDLCTCLFQFPVPASLFKRRVPVLFNNIFFCTAWTILFDFLNKISMFLVLLLSLSRAIAIARPFYRIRKKLIFGGFLMYCLLLIAHSIFMLLLKFSAIYGADATYCYLYFETGEEKITETQNSFITTEYILFSIEYGVPPLITFLSFLVCLVKLLKGSRVGATDDKRRTAAVTVTIFTAVFLLCNCPLFLLLTLYTTYLIVYGDEFSIDVGVFSNYFMLWYSWTICRILLTVLNATLNPIIYFFRMANFKKWIRNGCKLEETQFTVRST